MENKNFTLKQLFSLVDGRLSTKMDDVYEMLNHIFQEEFFTHHLPVAMNYLNDHQPKWFLEVISIYESLGVTPLTPFSEAMEILNKNEKTIVVPPLSQEYGMKDFGKYMIDNSLLLKHFG